MHITTEQQLKEIAEAFFGNIQDPIRRSEVELMYQAFKARLMYELRVSGGSHQGVVYGNLESRNSL